ncbi:hypothetical protein FKM82_024989 [Ascaphus truei]
MNTRRRLGSRNTENGVYVGPPQTQVLLSPTTAKSPSPPPPPALPADVMSCRDRTAEFISACKSLRGRQVTNHWGSHGGDMGG